MFTSKNPSTPGKPPPPSRQAPNRPPPPVQQHEEHHQQQAPEDDEMDLSIHTHAENAELCLTAQEVGDYWQNLNTMRLSFDLCDVTFSIQDCTFPAHRVVLSCCSRWLRSLLSDTSQETVNLDELDPAAFEVVLGYLYGEPLIFTPELSEEVVRVVRTFEMEDLEVRIWKYLIRSVTTKNCVWLHQLADAYDCPALKYEAWRVIKVVLEDYENQPEYIIKEPLLDGLPEGEINEDGEEKKENDDGENFDEDDESSDDEEGGRVSMLRKAAQSRVDESYLQNPDNVIPGQNKSKKPMTAKNVVMDWADRLQTFYEKCEPTLTTENQGAIALLKGRLPLSFYRDRLFAFYEEHNPEKLETIDDILEQWAGKEDELLKAITDKYKAAKEMADHLATYNELEHTLHNEEKEEEEEDQFER